MKKRFVSITAALVILIAAGAAYATSDNVKVFNNSLRTSGVQIRVSQMYETDEGIKSIDGRRVYAAGENCSYIPRVTASGKDCFVRLRLKVEMNEGSSAIVSVDDIIGLNGDWIKKGEWFYCQKILKKGEHSDVFQGITTPDVSGRQCSGFKTIVTADAIQAENFHPDFEKESPWGDVSIQVSDATGEAVIRTASAEEKDELLINDGGRIECRSTDLFSGLKDIMPGDTYEDTLTIRNVSGEKTALYFRTENNTSELLDEITLSLQCDDKQVYDGPLSSERLSSPLKLITLESGQVSTFKYSISLPENVNNAFQEDRDKVMWIFETHEKNGTGSSHIVRTGDGSKIGLFIALMLCTAFVIVLMAFAIKRGRNEKDR